jgi:membrane protease YdiL (CAAX protease family)
MNEAAAQPKPILKKIAVLCAAEIVLAFAINAMVGAKSLVAIAKDGPPVFTQIGLGISIGAVISVLVTASVLYVPLFSKLRKKLGDLVRFFDIGSLDPIWLSMCAGVGEEMLFRGSLQPMLGLWWTSLLFACAHVTPKQYRALDRGGFAYVASVFAGGLLLGTVFSEIGLIAAMAVHATWDLVVIFWLRHESRSPLMRV